MRRSLFAIPAPMNPPLPRYHTVLQAALQRIKQAARLAAERSVDSLGLAALSATSMRERDNLLAAQFELNKRIANFSTTFNDALDSRFARLTSGERTTGGSTARMPWESLSLVDDHEVEAQVQADRFSLAILHESEWELRELDGYIGSMLQLQRPDHERNPLRPESVGLALVAASDAVSDRPEVRKLVAGEVGRALSGLMRTAYADIVNDLRNAGIQPLGLAVRASTGGARSTVSPQGTDFGTTLGLPTESGSMPFNTSGGSLRTGAGSTGAGRLGGGSQWGNAGGARAMSGNGATFGQVDAQMMSLIRRLAFLGNVAEAGASGLGTDSLGIEGGLPAGATMPGGVTHPAGLTLPNLIVQHREELRQASTGALDHMVIDVVGSLFDQILSDPKVPPQMARQIARLQLPVLRVALGDVSFFSSRKHPVRRFVNRIASLACAFDDFSEGAGQQFLAQVKELVQEIVSGDFDQMEVYERKLADLEHFITLQSQQEVREHGDAPALLEQKETQLLQQQRYMQQLQAALAAVEMQDFLRDFLSQVWSQAIVTAQRKDDGGALAQRLRRTGRDLVMSVQTKGTPAERKAFLLALPQLMKDLNEGLGLIGWPESAKKAFFAQLLPAHSESLKGQSMRQLDYNLLVKQLDSILGAPMPKPGELPPAGVLPVLDQVVPDMAFSQEEAKQVGLVSESAIDWDGKVDIDLSAEPELSRVDIDINIDGLPPPEPAEPTAGASLADNVQIGFAYQMHIEGHWQKVRLSYVSPGRAFFVFTRGKKHQTTISLTHRMLVRMCDTGRMRAFENAYLIERATARARRQLAALRGGGEAAATRH